VGPTGPCGDDARKEECAGAAEAPLGAIQAAAAIQRGVVSPAQTSQTELADGNSKGGVTGAGNVLSGSGSSLAAIEGGSLPSGKSLKNGPEMRGQKPNLGASVGSAGIGSGNGGSSSGSSSGGANGGGMSSNGISTASSAGTNQDGNASQSATNSAAVAGTAYTAGGGAGAGGGGGSHGGLGFGSDASEMAAAGGSTNNRFGEKGEVNPQGSEDPNDYFTRLGLEDDLFKIVERRYRNQAVAWAKNDSDANVKRSQAH